MLTFIPLSHSLLSPASKAETFFSKSPTKSASSDQHLALRDPLPSSLFSFSINRESLGRPLFEILFINFPILRAQLPWISSTAFFFFNHSPCSSVFTAVRTQPAILSISPLLRQDGFGISPFACNNGFLRWRPIPYGRSRLKSLWDFQA